MFELNWAELLIISVVALIVIGPEDLPQMFRQLGRFTAKLRQMSREFSRAMEQAAKETGVADVAQDIKSATSAKSLGLDAVKEAADKFEKWDPLKNAAKPTATMPARSLVPPPMPAPVPMKEAAPDDAAEAADDLVDEALQAPEPTIHGPATQALYDKQALRAQVMAEQTAKLKAIEAGTFAPEAAPEAEPAPAPKKRAAKPKAEAEVAKPAAPAKTATKPAKPKAEAKTEAKTAPKPRKAAATDATKAPKKPRKTAGEETA